LRSNDNQHSNVDGQIRHVFLIRSGT